MPFKRLFAFFLDWFVLVFWGALIFGVVMIVSGGEPRSPSGPWIAQAIAFLVMTLPFTLYCALMESSRRQASLGKLFLKLRVQSSSGERLTIGRALVRNGIKFLPWEIGHFVAEQSIYSTGTEFPVWLWAAAVLALGLPLWYVALMLFTGRTPYDHIAAAVVTKAE